MYFEFDDARRIHQPYTDNIVRAPIWKTPAYNSPWMNWKRGMYAASTATFMTVPAMHIMSNAQILNYYYEWPKTRQEFNIFGKEVFKMPDFWKEMCKKTAFGLVVGGGDVAVKLAAWQCVHGGTWSPQEFSDSNSFKPLGCGFLSFGPLCWLTVPFENARRAYYADKTWPTELRRNYTSPTQALLRIPVEEGPTYLVRGGFPIAVNQLLFWSSYVCWYQWIKNKVFFMWVYNEYPYNWIKFLIHNASFAWASLLAYPAYHIREMVDVWPKERGGGCTWHNSYRYCFRWMIQNMETHTHNFMRGYTTWLKRYGIQYYIALWMADSLGMMSNCNESINSLETIFPIFAESV